MRPCSELSTVLPSEAPAGAAYGFLRTHLERAGRPIGANDPLMAAQAVALGCTLVTDNEREVGRTSELSWESWPR